jgi:hypothetical protein
MITAGLRGSVADPEDGERLASRPYPLRAMARRKRRSTSSVVLEIILVALVIGLLLIFFEPLSSWLGQFIANRMLAPSPSP